MNRAERRRRDKRAAEGGPVLARARQLAAAGRPEAAERLLTRRLRAAPQDPAALQLAGLCALARGETARAVARLRAARALRPDDAGLATNLAAALGRSGAESEALALLAETLEAAPGFAPAHFNRAVLLRRLDRQAEALPALEAALRLEPGYTKARAALAAVLLDLGRPAEALAAAEAVLAEDPGADETRFDAGLAARRLDRFAAAAAHFAAIGGNPAAAVQRGACLQELGRQDEALAAYRAALAADRGLYGAVTKELAHAAKGRLPLDAARLRHRLLG